MRSVIPWAIPAGLLLALATIAPGQQRTYRTYSTRYEREYRPGLVIAEVIGFTLEADRDSFIFIGKPPAAQQSAQPAPTQQARYTVPDRIDGALPRKPVKTAKAASATIDRVRVGQALSSCMDCHGKGEKRGGVTLFDGQGVFAPNVPAKEIWDAIESGSMPKRGSISEADKAVVKEWHEQTRAK